MAMTPQANEIFSLVQQGVPLANAEAMTFAQPAAPPAPDMQVADISPAQQVEINYQNALRTGDWAPSADEFAVPGVNLEPSVTAPGGGWLTPSPSDPGLAAPPMDPQQQPIGGYDVFST